VRRIVTAFSLLVLVLAFVAGCGGDDEEATPDSGCEDVDAPEPRDPGVNTLPPRGLDFTKTYALVFETNCGSFTVTLDGESAPNTSASLVRLTENGYFDDTIFHRIVPDFVIQGGDPTQTGTGGPGYKTVDAPAEDTRYVKGVVAMAKTDAEPPGTAGSQFFVVTTGDANLPPEYAVVGEVTGGLDVVERIGLLGDESQQPTQAVVISAATVSES
jgi:cyclophilin family peptidyl-prolyl cis-trans isomerase